MGWLKPLNIKSYTETVGFGQYSISTGKGMLNFKVVLIVGFAPDADGWVLMLLIIDEFGGTRLFKFNCIYAFLTGKIPGDCSPLNPKISMLQSNSSNLTLLRRSTSSICSA